MHLPKDKHQNVHSSTTVTVRICSHAKHPPTLEWIHALQEQWKPKNHNYTRGSESNDHDDEQRRQMQKSTKDTKKRDTKKLYDSIYIKFQNRQLINRFSSQGGTWGG